MKKSKSKARKPSPRRYFVALHQDALMEAFARGFVAPRPMGLEAEPVVTPGAVAHARGGAEWGDVVLLEVPAPVQEEGSVWLAQPLLLADAMGCWTRSADVAAEIDARLETFDDTVPGLVKIGADPALFPDELAATPQDSLPLDLDGGDLQSGAHARSGAERDAVALEKMAGGLSMLVSRARTGSVEFEALEHLLVDQADHRRSDGVVANIASRAYRALRPGRNDAPDERIYASVAAGLKDAFPKQGLDPVAFVERLDHSADLTAFIETFRKVLDNRIELSDSKLDDSGMVGQRALLVFLLAPRADELERLLRARTVGPVVAALASLLSGIYCGIGNISRHLKGPAPDTMLGVVQAASCLLDGVNPLASIVRVWDDKAAVRECIAIEGRELLVKTRQPPENLAQLLAAARNAGLEVQVDRDSGECSILTDGARVSLRVSQSALRLPAEQVVRLGLRGRGAKRTQPSKELLVALLDEELRPAVAKIDAHGFVCMEVEIDRVEALAFAVSHLLRAAGLAGLIQDEASSGKRKGTGSRGQKKPPVGK